MNFVTITSIFFSDSTISLSHIYLFIIGQFKFSPTFPRNSSNLPFYPFYFHGCPCSCNPVHLLPTTETKSVFVDNPFLRFDASIDRQVTTKPNNFILDVQVEFEKIRSVATSPGKNVDTMSGVDTLHSHPKPRKLTVDAT